jgi:hypothetical protein
VTSCVLISPCKRRCCERMESVADTALVYLSSVTLHVEFGDFFTEK